MCDAPSENEDSPRATRERRIVVLLVALGVLLHAPSLASGFFADDYLHQLVLGGKVSMPGMGPASLYDFGDRGAWEDAELGTGTFPWWTSADWRIRFYRPLASLSLWLDHALFGSHASAYHAVSLALWAAVLCVSHALFRALGLAPRTARLALFFLAVTDSAVLPVGWIANRNSLLVLLFASSALLAVAPAGSLARPGRVAAALGLAWLAALSKESGTAAFLVLAVRALRGRNESSRGSAALLLVSVASAVAFVGGLLLAGYGSVSIFYTEPWREPARFAERAAATLFAGGASLAGPFPLDALMFFPSALVPAAVAGALVLVPLARAVWRHTRKQRAGPLLAAWVLCALLPQTLAPPSERLLFEPAVASSGLLAMLLHSLVGDVRRDPAARGARLAARSLFALAGIGSLALALLQSIGLVDLSRTVRREIVGADVGSPELGRREVFVLQGDIAFVPFAMASTWAIETDDTNLRVWPLQLGRRGLLWRRTGERSFVLESLDEPFLTQVFESVYRTSVDPPAVGTRFTTSLFDALVVAVDAAGLRAVRFDLRDPVDAPHHRFLASRGGRLVALAPPDLGETLRLDALEPPHPFVP